MKNFILLSTLICSALSRCFAFVSISSSVFQTTLSVSRTTLSVPRRSHVSRSLSMAALPSPGDTVAVFGATGKTGMLVVQRLLDRGYKVRAVVRSIERAEKVLGTSESIEYAEGDVKDKTTLAGPLSGVQAIIWTAGTTAFPSSAWKDGNVPFAVNEGGINNVLDVAKSTETPLKRFVYMSSIGVERADQMPFPVLNLFGVLDSLARGEELIRNNAGELGYDFSIVRPGQITDTDTKQSEGSFSIDDISTRIKGMFTNPGLMNGVALQAGDKAQGEAKRVMIADVLVHALEQPGAANKSYTAISAMGPPPNDEKWVSLFDNL